MRWRDGKNEKGSGRPKFRTLRDFIMGLKTDSGNPAFYSVIPRMSGFAPGVVTLAILNAKDDPGKMELAGKIAKAPAAWFWHNFLLDLTEGCAQSLMDSFEEGPRMLCHESEYNPKTRVIKYKFAGRDFCEELEATLGLESRPNSPGKDVEMVLDGDAKEELLTSLKQNNDLDFNDNSDASRRTNFSQSTGNASNRSVNTAKLARDYKDKALDLANSNRKNADLKKQNDELAARIQAMETLVANFQQQGPPHLSGSAAAGSSPENQNNENGKDASAAAQG